MTRQADVPLGPERGVRHGQEPPRPLPLLVTRQLTLPRRPTGVLPRRLARRFIRRTGSPVRDPSDGSDKAVAIFGGIAAVVYLVAFALTPAHAPNSGSAGVRVVHCATIHRSQLLASDLCFALALALLMIFAAGLYRVIRRGEGEHGWLAIASLASVVAAAGIFGAGTALFMVVAYRPATDPAVARAFWDAGWLAYNSSGFAFGAWIAVVTAAALRRPVLPRWIGWIGIPVALISLVGPLAVNTGTGAFSPQGWFALVVGLTFAAWVLALSAAAWRSPRAPTTASSLRVKRDGAHAELG